MKQCQQHHQHSPHPMHGHQSHGHHYHHHVSYPSPSTTSVVSNHGMTGVSCCGPAVQPNSASCTLPSYSGGPVDQNGYCYRTRTLSMGPYLMPPDQWFGQWWSISPRAIGLFALSLVFILIWSSLLSGVLITHSMKENEIATHTAEMFEMYRDVGLFAFEVGQELVYALNTSLYTVEQNVPPANVTNTNNTIDIKENTANHASLLDLDSFRVKWNKTDSILQQLSKTLAVKGYLDFESDVQSQLEKLRSKCVHQVSNQWLTSSPPNNISVLYPMLTDCVHTFEQSFNTLDTILLKDISWFSEQHSKLAMTDFVIRNMPYTLFVRGMVNRFTTLGLGLILVRSNFTQSFNMSEYFHYYYSSRQLIESSFVWNYRFLQKYLELDRTDYQADMLVQFFDSRRAQENDFYEKMSSIFSRMFSIESLSRIRSYIKKKNVESVERLLENGNKTKFVADHDANSVSIQLNTDLIELMGLENIERVMFNHQKMLELPHGFDLAHKYDRLLRNQIGFMSRVQDFLNISISSHLTQSKLNEKHNLFYYIALAAILFLSLFFCLTVLMCLYCCSRPSTPLCHHIAAANNKSTLGRRMRRRLWNMSSPFSLFKSCFSAPFSSPTSPPRYPLLYKSSHQQMHQYQPHNSPNHQMMSHNSRPCTSYCASPNSFMVSSGKRTACGTGSRNPAAHSNMLVTASGKSTAPAYKFEKSRHSNGTGKLTETTSLMDEQSVPRVQASTSQSSCHSSGDMCCISCPVDNVCDPNGEDMNGCAKCAASGKCSTCCPYNRDDSYFGAQPSKHKHKGNTKDSKQSLNSSMLSVLSDSKNSTKSANKDTVKESEGLKSENEYIDS